MTKKIISLLLTVIAVAGLALPSFASNLKRYSITLDYETDQGMVSVSQTAAYEGDKIYVSAVAAPYYKLQSVSPVRTDRNVLIPVSYDKTVGAYCFTMPKCDVRIRVYFYQTGDPQYRVVLDYNQNTMQVWSNREYAKVGEMVEIGAKAKQPYQVVDSVTILDSKDNIVGSYTSVEGPWRFKMPASNVTVVIASKFYNPELLTMIPITYEYDESLAKLLMYKEYADEGDVVRVKFRPIDGYFLDEISVFETETGDPIKTASIEAGGYFYFETPDRAVTVKATFSSRLDPADEPETESEPLPETEAEPAPETLPETEPEAAEPAVTPHICHVETFSDTLPTEWYHEAVDYAVSNGIMNGVGDGLFAPSGTVTRAMVTTVLWRLADEPISAASIPYSDVPEGEWYTEAVRWAAENGILMYVSADDTLLPGHTVTREQFATMIYRFEAVTVGSEPERRNLPLDFSDISALSGFALPAVSWCFENGIIAGNADGTLLPQGTTTRAQLAKILLNYSNLKAS